MKIKVSIDAEIVVEFDEKSEDFNALFEGYKSVIDSGATYESLAENIADQIARYGIYTDMEAIGRVKCNGEKRKDWSTMTEVDSPINVSGDMEMVNGTLYFDICAELNKKKITI